MTKKRDRKVWIECVAPLFMKATVSFSRCAFHLHALSPDRQKERGQGEINRENSMTYKGPSRSRDGHVKREEKETRRKIERDTATGGREPKETQ